MFCFRVVFCRPVHLNHSQPANKKVASARRHGTAAMHCFCHADAGMEMSAFMQASTRGRTANGSSARVFRCRSIQNHFCSVSLAYETKQIGEEGSTCEWTPRASMLTPARHIAVIGSGIAGLSAAWLLTANRVTLYETEARLGGHSNTVMVPTENGSPSIPASSSTTSATTPTSPRCSTSRRRHAALRHVVRGLARRRPARIFERRAQGAARPAQQQRRPRFWLMVRDICVSIGEARTDRARRIRGV